MYRHHHHNARPAGPAPESELANFDAAGLAPLGADAAAPADLIQPKNENVQNRANGLDIKGLTKEDSPDCAGRLTSTQAGTIDRKRFATLRERLEKAGFSLIRTDADEGPVTFCASRWGMVRELRDLAAVESFADQVGAWIDIHEPGTLNAGPNPAFIAAQITELNDKKARMLASEGGSA